MTPKLRRLLLMPCSLQPVRRWDSPETRTNTTPTRTTSTVLPGLMTPAGLLSVLPGLLPGRMVVMLPLLWQLAEPSARLAAVLPVLPVPSYPAFLRHAPLTSGAS